MLGKIFIKDLLVRCRIGINEEEKQAPQDILINVELVAEVAPAIASDNIADTVDYRPVYHEILRLAENSRFDLVEKLAGAIADTALGLDARIAKVLVRVEKPHRFPFLQAVGVELEKSRV